MGRYRQLEHEVSGLKWSLQFSPEIEWEFRGHSARRQVGVTTALFVPVFLFAFLTPFFGPRLLHTPLELVPLFRWVMHSMIAPTALLAVLADLHPSLRRYSLLATVLAGLSLYVGLLYMFSEAAQVHFNFPAAIIAGVICAGMGLGQVHFFVALPIAAGSSALAIAVFHSQLGGTPAFPVLAMETISITMVGVVVGYTYERAARLSWLALQLSHELSINDGLTGINNRREFDRQLHRVFAQASRYHTAVAVMLLDIDYFKLLNDTHGHPYGDEALVTIASCLKDYTKRPLDIRGRVGGEEFAVALYDLSVDDAKRIGQDIIKAVESAHIAHHSSSVRPVVTASAGMVWLRPGPNDAPDAAWSKADQLLYRAKHSGRNQLVFESELDLMAAA